MPAWSRKALAIAQNLGELRSLCDTGFALAVHIRYTRPTLLYQTYAREWTDRYNEKGYMLADPTVHWGLANTGAMDWAMLENQDPEGVIAAAKGFGLTNGWTYATGPATSRSLGSMTCSRSFTAEERARICSIIDFIHTETEGFDSLSAAQQETLRNVALN